MPEFLPVDDAKYEGWDGERCQRCERPYALVWAAEDALWNEVVGGYNGRLCPDCFEDECNFRGIFPFFVAYREHVQITNMEALRAERDRYKREAEGRAHWTAKVMPVIREVRFRHQRERSRLRRTIRALELLEEALVWGTASPEQRAPIERFVEKKRADAAYRTRNTRKASE